MMQSPGLEHTARLIAENVISAVEHAQENATLHPLIHEALLVELLREVLSVMPTESSTVLADACNRCLTASQIFISRHHASKPSTLTMVQ